MMTMKIFCNEKSKRKKKVIVGKLNSIVINILKNQRYWDIDLEHHSN